jgi:hypothetical protein
MSFAVAYGVGFSIGASVRINPIDLKYILYNREAKGIKGIYVKLSSLVPALVALLLTAFYHDGSHVISTLQFAFTSCDDIIMYIYIIYVNIVVIISYDSWVWEVLCCNV